MSIHDETWDKPVFIERRCYCLGFLFDPLLEEVLLIRKNRGPETLIGKLNGLGGKCNTKENPAKAMEREFIEESNIFIPQSDWIKVCNIEVNGSIIYTYSKSSMDIYNYSQMESEEIGVYNLKHLFNELNYVPNLRWIIPMCLNKLTNKDSNSYQVNC